MNRTYEWARYVEERWPQPAALKPSDVNTAREFVATISPRKVLLAVGAYFLAITALGALAVATDPRAFFSSFISLVLVLVLPVIRLYQWMAVGLPRVVINAQGFKDTRISNQFIPWASVSAADGMMRRDIGVSLHPGSERVRLRAFGEGWIMALLRRWRGWPKLILRGEWLNCTDGALHAAFFAHYQAAKNGPPHTTAVIPPST